MDIRHTRLFLAGLTFLFAIVLFGQSAVGNTGNIIAVGSAELGALATTQTGALEVYVQSSDISPANLIADQFELSVSPSGSGISLTGVESPVTHPYVFPGSSPTGMVLGGGAVVEGGDFLPTGSDPLSTGAGLLLVDFSVAGGTPPGNYSLSISSDPDDSYLIDDTYANVPFSASDGQITIVPEPNSFLLLLPVALALTALAVSTTSRRRTT